MSMGQLIWMHSSCSRCGRPLMIELNPMDRYSCHIQSPISAFFHLFRPPQIYVSFSHHPILYFSLPLGSTHLFRWSWGWKRDNAWRSIRQAQSSRYRIANLSGTTQNVLMSPFLLRCGRSWDLSGHWKHMLLVPSQTPLTSLYAYPPDTANATAMYILPVTFYSLVAVADLNLGVGGGFIQCPTWKWKGDNRYRDRKHSTLPQVGQLWYSLYTRVLHESYQGEDFTETHSCLQLLPPLPLPLSPSINHVHTNSSLRLWFQGSWPRTLPTVSDYPCESHIDLEKHFLGNAGSLVPSPYPLS